MLDEPTATDQNSTDQNTSPSGDTPPPAKAPRRRRSTKAAAAATASGTTPGTEADSAADSAADTASGADEGAAAPATVAAAVDAPATDGPAADAAPAPAKRVRKAPAKKAAPRKRTAKRVADEAAATDAATDAPAASDAAGPDGTAADTAGTDAAGTDAVGTGTDAAGTDAARTDAARTDAAGTDAAGTGTDTSGSDLAGPLDDAQAAAVVLDAAEPVVDAVEDDPAVTQAAADDVLTSALTAPAEQEPPVPAKRTRTRRVPAVVTFQPPEPVADAPEAREEDDAPAPRRRRHAGTTGAVAPADLIPALLAPEPVAPPEGTEPPAARSAGDEDADEDDGDRPRRRRRGRRGRGPRRPEDEAAENSDDTDDDTRDGTGDDTDGADQQPGEDVAAAADDEDDEATSTTRRRRRRRRSGASADTDTDTDEAPSQVREPRARNRGGSGATGADEDGVRGITGSTRMAAKRVRRQEGRDSGRKRAPILSEAEFLARREAVARTMVVRQQGDRTQIAVLEDGVLVEHYVTRASAQSYAGNVYLGRVQNVLPSMEAAFVDIGKGRNAVLYAGEVNYDGHAGGRSRSIESVLKSGQEVLVQVSKDPMGHKGARLTGQISLPGRYLVYVPEGSMTGISRKLPEPERERLKKILKKLVPDDAGVIIRTAAEGASEEEIAADVRRLQAQWEVIQTKAAKGGAPVLLHAEPDLLIRVVRDVFNEDFAKLVVQGDSEWDTIRDYVEFVAPDLAPRLSRHTAERDVFAEHRIDEQLAKALDRKVWLPSGGSLVIDRTEAMVVIDVNTGKYVGKGGNLEETVTRNNLEAAEEIARQLRLRDLGGIIVVDFIDMVLESNRDLVVRRLVECLGRDRTKHQVAEVTSLGLVQMTRKRVGQGLLESFSEPCDRCNGRGVLVSTEPVDDKRGGGDDRERSARGDRSARSPKPARSGSAEGTARVAEATLGARSETPAEAPAETPAEAPAETPAEEAGEDRPRRRRRGGRGAGTATVPPSDELAEVLPASTAAPSVVPDVVPELADQPGSAGEDQPVLPPELGSIADPVGVEPAETDADDALVTATVEPDAAVNDAPVAVEPPGVDEVAAPGVDEVAAPGVDEVAAAAPRRRRRATSRPAGPPAVQV